VFKNVIQIWYEGYLHHLNWFIHIYLDESSEDTSKKDIGDILRKVVDEKNSSHVISMLKRVFVSKESQQISAFSNQSNS